MNENIANFLRDAQYRVAELTNEANDIATQKPRRWRALYEEKIDLRAGLLFFMGILYESYWPITNGINYLAHWTQAEIDNEIDYWRAKAGLNPVAWLSFTGYSPSIIDFGNGESGLPSGSFGQYIVYNISGVPVAETISPYGGATPTETIAQYFDGRA